MELLHRKRESLGMSLVISRKIHNDYVHVYQAKESTDDLSQRDTYTLLTAISQMPPTVYCAPTSRLSTHESVLQVVAVDGV